MLEGTAANCTWNHNCDYCRDPYRRTEGSWGEPTKAFKSHRPLCIHHNRGLSNTKRYTAFLRHANDENEAMQGEGYAVWGNSFDLSESSLSSADRDRKQRELNDYTESMPSRPTDYPSDKDTSSDSGNGFENLCWDWRKNKERNALSIHIAKFIKDNSEVTYNHAIWEKEVCFSAWDL